MAGGARGAAMLAMGVLFLAGCAGGGQVYAKPGASYEEWRRDDLACRQAARGEEARGVLDRDAYARCMRERGYRLRD